MHVPSPDKPARLWTIANGLSAARLLAAFPLAAMILRSGGDAGTGALLVYLLAALSDAADGYIARARGEVSSLGAALDPVADKLFGLLVFYALVQAGVLPAALLVLLLFKEAALLAGGALLLRGTGRVISARPLGKAATVLLFTSFALILAGYSGAGAFLTALGVLCSLAAGIDYAWVAARMRGTSAG